MWVGCWQCSGLKLNLKLPLLVRCTKTHFENCNGLDESCWYLFAVVAVLGGRPLRSELVVQKDW